MSDTETSPTVAELLEFERAHPTAGDRKGALVRSRFGIPHPRYVQLLLQAIATTEALEHDAQLVHQIQRRLATDRQRRAHNLGQTH